MYKTSMPLEFITDPRDTEMFSWLQDEAFLYEDHALLWNGHNWGIDVSKFETDPGVAKMFTPTAVSYMPDPDNRQFVVTYEGKNYPIYGTLFHPEQAT